MKVELSTILQYGDAGVNIAESRVTPDRQGGDRGVFAEIRREIRKVSACLGKFKKKQELILIKIWYSI